jgi:type II secretory pathway pseudopilin PulG
MSKSTLVAIVIALLLIATGTAVYVMSRQREAARQAEHARQEAQAAQEYHEARKKTGEFLVPDTKSQMRFGRGVTPQPTQTETTK